MKYNIVSLSDLLSSYEKENIKEVLNTFESENKDVEHFLKFKSIEFENVGLARTTLIFSKSNEFIGYFSISMKPLIVTKKNWKRLSNTVKRKLSPMDNESEQGNHEISSILLGQLSKNKKFSQLISGDILLSLAYDKIRYLWKLGGGRFLYAEVDENEKLDSFYTKNGFRQIMITNDEGIKTSYKTVNNQCLYVKKLSDI